MKKDDQIKDLQRELAALTKQLAESETLVGKYRLWLEASEAHAETQRVEIITLSRRSAEDLLMPGEGIPPHFLVRAARDLARGGELPPDRALALFRKILSWTNEYLKKHDAPQGASVAALERMEG